MRIAVAGGTGTLGRHLTAELSSRGHEVRVLSRGAPEYRVDLATGEGLEPALRGCDVAGPEVTELRTLARTWRSVTGRGLALLPVYVPGQVGRALRAGALTTGQAEVHGRISFSAWLEAGAGAAVTARGGPEPR
jgi:uncharacterized protein YbjT (DUF2867 family)